MCPLPTRTGLETSWISVPRGGHQVTYRPLPAGQREAWRSPTLDALQDDFRDAAANLAANVFDILRVDALRAKTAASPYPRLRQLLDALGDVEAIADGNGYRFRDPRTGRELRLADIPGRTPDPSDR